MALTTTTGLLPVRPFTISAAREIAVASSTDVPPNFITIIGKGSPAKMWNEEKRARRGVVEEVVAQRLVRPVGFYNIWANVLKTTFPKTSVPMKGSRCLKGSRNGNAQRVFIQRPKSPLFRIKPPAPPYNSHACH